MDPEGTRLLTYSTTLWGIKNTEIFYHNFYNTWPILIRSVLDKLATRYDKIFQLHLNNVATLPCKT